MKQVPERVIYRLSESGVLSDRIQIKYEPISSSASIPKCGSGQEMKFADFAPAPSIVLAQAIAKELESIRAERSGTPTPLPSLVLTLVEFRAFIGAGCSGPFVPKDRSGMAAISPLGPLFGMLLDRMAHEASADRSGFVDLRMVSQFNGITVPEEYRIYPKDRTHEAAVEEAIGYHARAVALRFIEDIDTRAEKLK